MWFIPFPLVKSTTLLKDLVHSGFPHVWTQSVGYRGGTTRRGERKRTLPSPPVMFFSVCAASPVAILRKMSMAGKQKNKCPLQTKTTAHEFPMFFFLTLVSPTPAKKLCSHLFSVRGLCIDLCALADASFRYFRALFGALL